MARKDKEAGRSVAEEIASIDLELGRQYRALNINQTDLAGWLTILLGKTIKQDKLSLAMNADSGMGFSTREDILQGMKQLRDYLKEYRGEDKKQFADFLTRRVDPSLQRKKYVLYGAILLFCIGGYCIRVHFAKKTGSHFRLVNSVECRVYVRGNDMVGKDTIPWLGVKDSNGSPLWLNEGDSLVMIVNMDDRIQYSKKNGYVCNALGDLLKMDEPKEIHRRPHKIAATPVGSLVHYIRTDGRWKFDSSFLTRRQIPIDAPKMVANPIDPDAGLVKNNGFLFLAVNDHYLYHHTMDSLLSVRDSLLRPAKDAWQAYTHHNCDWFYDDNPSDNYFAVRILVYRKK